MFKRRDIPPVLLLLLLIILVMLTLSQILIVHNGRYGKNVHNMRKLQLELREMDINLHTMMMQNVPSIELSRRLLQNEINSQRVANIIAEAAQPDRFFIPAKKKEIKNEKTVEFPELSVLKSTKDEMLQTNDDLAMTNDELLENKDALVTDTSYTDMKSMNDDDNLLHSQQTMNSSSVQVPYCPPVPPNLTGHIFIDFEHKHDYSEMEVIQQNPNLLLGGAWRPRRCVARHKVAIIIPYRDRKEHLIILLSHLHLMLRRQQLDYRIYVIEQYGVYTFNKARIMNIAFVEALKQYNFQCFVFHDVDLVPEDDRNMYSCPVQPRHMSVAIDEMGYKLAYQELVGGVLNMRTEHFQRVNGYSNLYWGWGAEDDDMAYRIMYVGLKITRPPDNVARYKMIKHTKRKPSDWRKRAKLLYTGTRRFQFDGLNSLQYKLISIQNNKLFTHILVDIGKPPKASM